MKESVSFYSNYSISDSCHTESSAAFWSEAGCFAFFSLLALVAWGYQLSVTMAPHLMNSMPKSMICPLEKTSVPQVISMDCIEVGLPHFPLAVNAVVDAVADVPPTVVAAAAMVGF